MLIAFHYRVFFIKRQVSYKDSIQHLSDWRKIVRENFVWINLAVQDGRFFQLCKIADFFCLKVNSFRRSHESPAISLRRGILREFLLFVFRPDTLSRFDSLIGSSFSFCSCVYVIPALAFFIVFSPLLELNKQKLPNN